MLEKILSLQIAETQLAFTHWLTQAKDWNGSLRDDHNQALRCLQDSFFLLHPDQLSSLRLAPFTGLETVARSHQAHIFGLNIGGRLSLLCQKSLRPFTLPRREDISEDGGFHFNHVVRIRGLNIPQSRGLKEGG